MNFLLTLALLLFELNFSYGYSIPKAEQTNAVDVYEVQENNSSSVRIINPRPDKPTLREIIFYHVIEKPYGDTESPNEKENEIDSESIEHPEFEETQRSFTNSHGYQFLEDDAKNLIQEDTKETNKETTDSNHEETADEETEYVIYYDDENPEDATEKDNRESKDEAPTTEASVKISEDEIITEAAAITESPDHLVEQESLANIVPTTQADVIQSTTETSTASSTSTEARTTVEDEVEIEKKATRNRLFDQLRQKYQKPRKPTNSSSRRKREINIEDIPDAPILPELNYDDLPEYVRALISTEKPKSQISNSDYEIAKFNGGEVTKEIAHKLEDILSSLKTYEVREEDEEKKVEKEHPRTYGMHLNGDQGYVWNDLWSTPGVSFDVGDVTDSVSVEDTKDEIPTNTPAETDKPDTIDDSSKPTESNENLDDDLKDIFVNILSHLELPKEIETPFSSEEFSHEENEKPQSELKTLTTNKNNIEEHENLKSTEELKPHKHSDKIQSLLDVLEDENFWTWIEDWTHTYMDELTKYIKKTVEKEVEKQISAGVKKLVSKKDSKQDKEPKKDSLVIDGEEIPITHNTNFDSDDEDVDESDKTSDLLRRRTNKKKNEKPVPVVNATEVENNSKKDTQSPIHLGAHTIYGNTVASDKVTNIFIFNLNKEKNKVAVNKTSDTTNHASKPEHNFNEKPGETNKDEESKANSDKTESVTTESSPATTVNNNDIDDITTTTKSIDANDNDKDPSESATVENPSNTHDKEENEDLQTSISVPENENKTNDKTDKEFESTNDSNNNSNTEDKQSSDHDSTEINKEEVTVASEADIEN